MEPDSQVSVYSLPSTESDVVINTTTPSGLDSSDVAYYIFYLSILFLITLANIFGNLLVITSVVRFRHLRTSCNYCIVNLAVSDLLMGIIYTPYNISHMEVPEIQKTMDTWLLCFFLLAGVEVFHCCSAWSLVAITVTRYISITDPLMYHERVTPRRTAIGILSVWGFAFVYSCAQYARPVGDVNFNGICRYELMYDKVWHTLILTTLVVLIPWFVMITLYARIWTIARRQVRAINWEEGTAFKREWKVTKMVALVLGYFVLAWFPMLLFLFFGLSCQCEINRYFRAVGRIMLHSNSAINVVIYGICNPEFRVAFRRILLQVFCCKKVLPNGNVSNWKGTIIHKRKGRLAKLCDGKRPFKITFL